jgi:hypothetical protein
MDKEMLEQLGAELKEIIRIEQVMRYSSLTSEDVNSLKELAEKGIPRAELFYGVFKLTIERNKVEGYQWLQRCRKHCNAVLKARISHVYKLMKLSQNRSKVKNKL